MEEKNGAKSRALVYNDPEAQEDDRVDRPMTQAPLTSQVILDKSIPRERIKRIEYTGIILRTAYHPLPSHKPPQPPFDKARNMKQTVGLSLLVYSSLDTRTNP